MVKPSEVAPGSCQDGVSLRSTTGVFSQTNMLARLARMRHITGLAKIPATVEFVTNHIEETGRKIVVFVHHKDVGQLLIREFRDRGYPVIRMSADISPAGRFEVQEEFNKANPTLKRKYFWSPRFVRVIYKNAGKTNLFYSI